MCMDAANAETYRIVLNGKIVGGAILHSNHQTNENELDAQAVADDSSLAKDVFAELRKRV